jgi:hypothetical protein
MLHLAVGHRGEPGEHVAQVGVGIDAEAAAHWKFSSTNFRRAVCACSKLC